MPPALPNSPPGWKPICPKVSPSSPCHSPTNSDCAPATLWNGSTRNSSAAPASPASSPMKPPSCAWSPPCSMNSATNGKPPKFTSPWKTIPSPQFDANEFTERNVARPLGWLGWLGGGFGVAWGWLWGGFGGAFVGLWGGVRVALGSHSVGYQ